MAKAPIDVRFYRSSVKGRRPLPANMGYGDLAINYHHDDPALIIKGDDDALIEFKPGSGVTVSAAAPAVSKDGDLWWDTASARLFVRYTSGTPAVSAWVDASPAAVGGGSSGAAVTIDGTAPATAKDGDLWWDNVGGRLFIYYTSGTPAAGSWIDASPTTLPPALANALTYKGTVDPTAAGSAPAAPAVGDIYVASKAGTAAAGWTGLAGGAVSLHELLVWDGTEWDGAGMAASPRTPWQGAVNTTAARAAGYTPVAGDLLQVSTAGAAHADWPGVKAAAVVGDVYLFDGSKWQQLGPDGAIVDATATTKGVVQLADAAALAAGTAGRVVDAAQLRDSERILYDTEFMRLKIDTRLHPSGNPKFKVILGNTIDVDVDWGDGVLEKGLTTSPEHTYAKHGVYIVTVFPNNNSTVTVDYDDEDPGKAIVDVLSLPDGAQIDFETAWFGCENIRSFPYFDLKNSAIKGQAFEDAFSGCHKLFNFPLLDTSAVTSFATTFSECRSLCVFPPIDVSAATDFRNAWESCSGLIAFPILSYDNGISFARTWKGCSSLHYFLQPSFPKANTFQEAWQDCVNLVDFPPHAFDRTDALIQEAFENTFAGCVNLSAQSIENILVSLDTNGARSIHLDLGGASETTWTAAAKAAKTSLVGKGWTITNTP